MCGTHLNQYLNWIASGTTSIRVWVRLVSAYLLFLHGRARIITLSIVTVSSKWNKASGFYQTLLPTHFRSLQYQFFDRAFIFSNIWGRLDLLIVNSFTLITIICNILQADLWGRSSRMQSICWHFFGRDTTENFILF